MDLLSPTTIEEAVSLLAAHESARCISGGATLVAMMNAGLVQPDILVSLKQIHALRGIEAEADGTVRIGAMSRHAQTASSVAFREGQRVVPSAASRIANLPVRNMGTIGGSLSFADPAADYLAALTAAEAVIEAVSPRGKRQVPVDAFVTDWYTTVLAQDEIVTAVLVPPAPTESLFHYEKLARVSGDFAIVSVAMIIAFDGDDCRSIRLAVGGCGPAPLRRRDAEEVLEGTRLEPDRIAQAGAMLVEISDPVDDVRGTADYRRAVLPRLLTKVLSQINRRRIA
jgi:carbon-monoxide dehydrogenase medium subunit